MELYAVNMADESSQPLHQWLKDSRYTVVVCIAYLKHVTIGVAVYSTANSLVTLKGSFVNISRWEPQLAATVHEILLIAAVEYGSVRQYMVGRALLDVLLECAREPLAVALLHDESPVLLASRKVAI